MPAAFHSALAASRPAWGLTWSRPENARGSVRNAVAWIQALLAQHELPVEPLLVCQATARARYGAPRAPAFYVFRPDGHIAARWRHVVPDEVGVALARAIGRCA